MHVTLKDSNKEAYQSKDIRASYNKLTGNVFHGNLLIEVLCYNRNPYHELLKGVCKSFLDNLQFINEGFLSNDELDIFKIHCNKVKQEVNKIQNVTFIQKKFEGQTVKIEWLKCEHGNTIPIILSSVLIILYLWNRIVHSHHHLSHLITTILEWTHSLKGGLRLQFSLQWFFQPANEMHNILENEGNVNQFFYK